MKAKLRYLTYLNMGLTLACLCLNLYMHEPWLGWACAFAGWTVVALKET